jgi:ABC-type cobalamin/Fe3+-siderophores transport system ATPase subunit
MNDLVLDSLKISRFRAFQHITIDHLGRVNLIVGKNNVGKSSLLDALQLYARRGSPNVIWQILGAHDENARSRLRNSSIEENLNAVKYLFYGRRELKSPIESITIGPLNSAKDVLHINIQWFNRVANEEGIPVLQKTLFEDELNEVETASPRFTIQMGNQREYNLSLEPGAVGLRAFRQDIKELNCFLVDSNGLDKRQISYLWDSIALTPQEKEVLNALRIIAPGVEDISVIGDPNSPRERTTIIKVVDIDEPLPIRSLGDGMQRMLGIALALINAKNGLLLVDEIENGLHYSVQLDLWQLIFELAQRLNVQVFATSHSWDCIEAFQKIAKATPQEEGVLIRLEHKKGRVVPVVFDENKLAIATREQIEVR